ncbi:Mitogen-activated protein kinase kinase kinase YODA [Acorus calamus]|uniref:Mitogen-activated protein kinase kinase kinase YODA n=1 Tax=Acorus calamus TaxID=4465 RepID=A0AAV9CRU7_ACOCL|nr:Mitogen-activated protein kinase kinase kinase YODA [Acorus calamus]
MIQWKICELLSKAIIPYSELHANLLDRCVVHDGIFVAGVLAEFEYQLGLVGLSNAKKKTSKETFLDTLRKFRGPSEEKGNVKSGGTRRRSNDAASEMGSRSRAGSRSPSPSTKVSRCQSFSDRPHAQPLPLPGGHPGIIRGTQSGISLARPMLEKRGKPPLFLPLPTPDRIPSRTDATDNDVDLATASVSSNCSIDSDSDSRLPSPQGNEIENRGRNLINGHSSGFHKDQSPLVTRKNTRETTKAANISYINQIPSPPSRRGVLGTPNSQIPRLGALGSAPDSSMSSPSRSPIRVVCPDQIPSSAFWAAKPYPDVSLVGSGHCSSPGSGQNSGHNSMGGDMSAQIFWQHSRGSPECSPIPSPRMTSPGPSSRIHSGTVSPRHPRAGVNLHCINRDIKGANILVDPNGRVKLADFGMAKHITGQSCPLSFKGSPYWMAPEVIKNSSGCNYLVDIWSLGCTVLEMATSKPPWSQYEGIAAMFKIGNSKELPAIPDHLSDDGKDFIRLSPIEKPIVVSEPLELPSVATNDARSKGNGHARNLSSLDMKGLGIHQFRGAKPYPLSSDNHMAKTCPVSPIGSPLLNSRSPQHINGRMSPSPISSPRTTSGSSTPLTGCNGSIPFHHSKQSVYVYEGFGSMPRSPNNLYMNGSTYHDPKPDLFRGMQPGSPIFRDMMVSETDILGKPFGGRAVNGESRDLYDGQSMLADRVSQQLLRDHVKLNPTLDLTPGSPKLGRSNGI